MLTTIIKQGYLLDPCRALMQGDISSCGCLFHSNPTAHLIQFPQVYNGKDWRKLGCQSGVLNEVTAIEKESMLCYPGLLLFAY
jgi:hypothetical protein